MRFKIKRGPGISDYVVSTEMFKHVGPKGETPLPVSDWVRRNPDVFYENDGILYGTVDPVCQCVTEVTQAGVKYEFRMQQWRSIGEVMSRLPVCAAIAGRTRERDIQFMVEGIYDRFTDAICIYIVFDYPTMLALERSYRTKDALADQLLMFDDDPHATRNLRTITLGSMAESGLPAIRIQNKTHRVEDMGEVLSRLTELSSGPPTRFESSPEGIHRMMSNEDIDRIVRGVNGTSSEQAARFTAIANAVFPPALFNSPRNRGR